MVCEDKNNRNAKNTAFLAAAIFLSTGKIIKT